MPTPKETLDELLEMSSSIRNAVLARGEGEVLASTLHSPEAEKSMTSAARDLITSAATAAEEMGKPRLTQMFIETRSGCMFVAMGENDTWLAAVTSGDPTVGLVLYDINTALKTVLELEAAGEYSK
ncbi:MAG: roadblock/LC7 domain-containing protein [Gaiellales bacterium]|nr:MAG: roadblock/LC7 domain-containing protein [Gaiellales bacterium]